ncbi:MAG: peptidylprolyl isomerase [Planctomycetota bacterium]
MQKPAAILFACVLSGIAVAQQPAAVPQRPQTPGPGAQRAPGQIEIKDADLPNGVFLRIKDKDISRDAYASWLLESKGTYYLYEFVDRILVQREAEERGLIVSPEELERAYQDDWQKMVQLRFKGEEAKFLEDIQRSGRTIEEHKRERMDQLRMDLLKNELIKSERNPSDDELQKTFKEQYGEDGQKRHVRVAFFSKFNFSEEKLRQRPTREEYDEQDKLAKKRGEDFLEAVKGGKSFADLVKTQSDDLTSPVSGDPTLNYKSRSGDVDSYRPNLFGREIDADILKLSEPNQLTGVMAGRQGYFVAQLVERRPIKFEEVRDQLYQQALTRPANAGEIYELQQRLREKAEILKARPKKP